MKKKDSGSDIIEYLKRKENLLQQGAVLIKSEKYDELIKICNNLIKQNPRSAEPWMLKGVALKKKKEFKLAFECLDNALKRSIGNWQALQEMALLQLELGNFSQAIYAFEGVIKLQSDLLGTVQAPVLFNIAVSHEMIGQFDKAIDYYIKLITVEPVNSNGWFNLGVCLQKLGKYERAIKCLDKALKFNPNLTSAIEHKNEILKDMEHKDLAIIKNQIFLRDDGRSTFKIPKDLENAEKIDLPPDKMSEYKTAKINLMLNHGISIHELGGSNVQACDEIISLDKAIEQSDIALSIVPYDLEVIFEKGKALLQLRKYSEAVKHFDDSLKLESKLSTFMDISGTYYKNTEQKELDKNKGLVWLYKATALEEIGQYDEALISYKKAKEYSNKIEPPKMKTPESSPKDASRIPKFCGGCGKELPQKTLETLNNKGRAYCNHCGKLIKK